MAEWNGKAERMGKLPQNNINFCVILFDITISHLFARYNYLTFNCQINFYNAILILCNLFLVKVARYSFKKLIKLQFT